MANYYRPPRTNPYPNHWGPEAIKNGEFKYAWPGRGSSQIGHASYQPMNIAGLPPEALQNMFGQKPKPKPKQQGISAGQDMVRTANAPTLPNAAEAKRKLYESQGMEVPVENKPPMPVAKAPATPQSALDNLYAQYGEKAPQAQGGSKPTTPVVDSVGQNATAIPAIPASDGSVAENMPGQAGSDEMQSGANRGYIMQPRGISSKGQLPDLKHIDPGTVDPDEIDEILGRPPRKVDPNAPKPATMDPDEIDNEPLRKIAEGIFGRKRRNEPRLEPLPYRPKFRIKRDPTTGNITFDDSEKVDAEILPDTSWSQQFRINPNTGQFELDPNYMKARAVPLAEDATGSAGKDSLNMPSSKAAPSGSAPKTPAAPNQSAVNSAMGRGRSDATTRGVSQPATQVQRQTQPAGNPGAKSAPIQGPGPGREGMPAGSAPQKLPKANKNLPQAQPQGSQNQPPIHPGDAVINQDIQESDQNRLGSIGSDIAPEGQGQGQPAPRMTGEGPQAVGAEATGTPAPQVPVAQAGRPGVDRGTPGLTERENALSGETVLERNAFVDPQTGEIDFDAMQAYSTGGQTAPGAQGKDNVPNRQEILRRYWIKKQREIAQLPARQKMQESLAIMQGIQPEAIPEALRDQFKKDQQLIQDNPHLASAYAKKWTDVQEKYNDALVKRAESEKEAGGLVNSLQATVGGKSKDLQSQVMQSQVKSMMQGYGVGSPEHIAALTRQAEYEQSPEGIVAAESMRRVNEIEKLRKDGVITGAQAIEQLKEIAKFNNMTETEKRDFAAQKLGKSQEAAKSKVETADENEREKHITAIDGAKYKMDDAAAKVKEIDKKIKDRKDEIKNDTKAQYPKLKGDELQDKINTAIDKDDELKSLYTGRGKAQDRYDKANDQHDEAKSAMYQHNMKTARALDKEFKDKKPQPGTKVERGGQMFVVGDDGRFRVENESAPDSSVVKAKPEQSSPEIAKETARRDEAVNSVVDKDIKDAEAQTPAKQPNPIAAEAQKVTDKTVEIAKQRKADAEDQSAMKENKVDFKDIQGQQHIPDGFITDKNGKSIGRALTKLPDGMPRLMEANGKHAAVMRVGEKIVFLEILPQNRFRTPDNKIIGMDGKEIKEKT